MAGHADADLLRRATASDLFRVSANPYGRQATQLLTQLWKGLLRCCLSSFPMSRFFDDFSVTNLLRYRTRHARVTFASDVTSGFNDGLESTVEHALYIEGHWGFHQLPQARISHHLCVNAITVRTRLEHDV